MDLTQSAYIQASHDYESSLDNLYKKENGIFYTDLSLAKAMVRALKLPKDAVVLDPCCGSGVFLFAAKTCGLAHLYGIDRDENAIRFCKKYVGDVVFAASDSIGQRSTKVLRCVGLSEKPDVIIGNPPYVPLTGEIHMDFDLGFKKKTSASGNNLFVAALMRALELVKDDGLVSYIIPKNFLHVAGYRLLRQKLLKEKTIVSIVDIGAYFKNIRGEQIILTVKNCVPETSHKIMLKTLSGNRFRSVLRIAQHFYTDEILLFTCPDDYTTYQKLTAYQTLADLLNGYVGRGKSL